MADSQRVHPGRCDGEVRVTASQVRRHEACHRRDAFITPDDVRSMKVAELRKVLELRNLESAGKKQTMVERLLGALGSGSKEADEEVSVTGERTFAQRDAESRKRAVDLDAGTPRKRGSAAVGHMEERVVKARSVCTAAVEQRVRELAQPALDEYMADQIDEATLKQRKSEARKKATAEHLPLATLDLAFAAFTEAVTARESARLLYTKAEEAEDAAEAKLAAALREMEKGQAAPSGVKAESVQQGKQRQQQQEQERTQGQPPPAARGAGGPSSSSGRRAALGPEHLWLKIVSARDGRPCLMRTLASQPLEAEFVQRIASELGYLPGCMALWAGEQQLDVRRSAQELSLVDKQEVRVEERAPPLKLKLTRVGERESTVTVLLHPPDGTFSQLLAAYCGKTGLQAAGYRLQFDGDTLSPAGTPADANMEDGDLIEVTRAR